MKDIVYYSVILLVLVVAVFLGPLFTILAINTLFSTAIPITFGTWLAAWWLNSLLWYKYVANIKKG